MPPMPRLMYRLAFTLPDGTIRAGVYSREEANARVLHHILEGTLASIRAWHPVGTETRRSDFALGGTK